MASASFNNCFCFACVEQSALGVVTQFGQFKRFAEVRRGAEEARALGPRAARGGASVRVRMPPHGWARKARVLFFCAPQRLLLLQ